MEHATPEPALSTGLPAPGFSLPDLDGVLHRLEDTPGRIVILNFWSAECPWSARADTALKPLLLGWGNRVVLLTIASNANEFPDLLRRVASERELAFVLHDSDHQVADLYGAITTPHLFVIDANGILRYQGAFDDVTFRQRTPRQAYLRNAVEALLNGRSPEPAQTPPYGCTVVRYIP